MRLKKGEPESEILVGNCCGDECPDRYPVTLFKVPGIYRYRCAHCFEKETGYRHHLAPVAARPVHLLSGHDSADNQSQSTNS